MWLECMLATNAQNPRKSFEINWTAICRAIYLEAANTVLCRQYPTFWDKAQTLKTL
jgi:hypothetical protein